MSRTLDLASLDLGERGDDPLACAHRELVSEETTVGVWEAGPGADVDVETDEVFLVLSGSGTVGLGDGSRIALAPYTLVRLRAGEPTRWEVAERLRKVYAAVPAGPSGASRVLAADVASLPLTGASHSGHWVEGGWPSATAEVLDHLGPCRVGVWETTTGVAADIEQDEVLVVIGGAGSVHFESDGTTAALRPGVCLRLREGERTEWTVTADLRVVSFSLGSPGSLGSLG